MTSDAPDEGTVHPLLSQSTDRRDIPATRPRRHAVVLGMHRSGTSLTARLLSDLGWYLGRPDELLGPREDNPDGFFERAEIQVFNDRLLSRLGATWDGPPEPEELHKFDAKGVEDQLAALVRGIVADAGPSTPFALKDPRLCVLWPLWEPHLPPTATLVLSFRHPAEVAASLFRRDGLPMATGLALWEEYVRRALDAAKDRAAIVVRYGDLIAQPEASMENLAAALGATVPPGWAQAVRPELYRNRLNSDEDWLTANQRDLWSWIEQAPIWVDQIDPEDVPGRTAESSTELIRSRRNTVKIQAEVEQLRQSLADVSSELVRRAERESRLAQTLRENSDALGAARLDAQASRDQRDEAGRAVRAKAVELSVIRSRLRHHETARIRQEKQGARDSARGAQLARELESMELLVESLRQRRLEQAQQLDTVSQERREAQERLKGARDELAIALSERDSLQLVARAREQVIRHERDQLLRAVTIVEGERRLHEATVASMLASRAWRWGRILTSPRRWMSGRRAAT